MSARQASFTRYVFPSYGTAEIVEMPFRNPYSEPHAFTIDWDDQVRHLLISPHISAHLLIYPQTSLR